MSAVTYLVLPVSASAAELTTESTVLSDPTTSHAATQYTLTQSGVTTTPIKCIKVLFSTAADGTGGLPTGMSLGTPTFTGLYVPTPASWTATVAGAAVNLTYATGETPASASGRTIILNGITNGSTANTTYYATVSTYNDVNCSSSSVDTNGKSTFVFTNGVVVSATVNPTLTFTVDSTTCDLGVLGAAITGKCSHTMTAASNATSGYAISYISSATLTSGANTITANGGTAVANAVGGEQFGLNLKLNTTPAIGANVSGSGSGVATTQYNTSNSFAFDTLGATVATTSAPSLLNTFTVSYIANIDAVTQAGQYTKVQTYNITATY